MGEFLDAAFRMYRRNVQVFVGLNILLGVAPVLIAYPNWLITNVAATAAFSFIYPSTLFVAAALAVEGKAPSLWSTLRQTARRAPRILGLALALVGATVLCVIPPLGLWLLVRWSAAIPAMLVEGLDVGPSLARSSSLIRGHWWSSFSRLLVTLLLTYVVLYALVTLGVLVALANPVRGTILGFFSFLLVVFAFVSAVPLIPIALTVLYQELRRAEGSDLEHLAKLTGDAA